MSTSQGPVPVRDTRGGKAGFPRPRVGGGGTGAWGPCSLQGLVANAARTFKLACPQPGDIGDSAPCFVFHTRGPRERASRASLALLDLRDPLASATRDARGLPGPLDLQGPRDPHPFLALTGRVSWVESGPWTPASSRKAHCSHLWFLSCSYQCSWPPRPTWAPRTARIHGHLLRGKRHPVPDLPDPHCPAALPFGGMWVGTPAPRALRRGFQSRSGGPRRGWGLRWAGEEDEGGALRRSLRAGLLCRGCSGPGTRGLRSPRGAHGASLARKRPRRSSDCRSPQPSP